MDPIRYKLERDSIPWRIAWRTHEAIGTIRRLRWRMEGKLERATDRIKPHACISGGTDCDGMRYAGVSFHWTLLDAAAAVEATYHNAEGPFVARIVSGTEGREWQADYEPDTRDRYAESMNY